MKLMGPGRQWDLQDSVGRGGLDFGESVGLWILDMSYPYRAGQDDNETKTLLFACLSAVIYKCGTYTQILKSPTRESDGKSNVYWVGVEVDRFSFLLSSVCHQE